MGEARDGLADVARRFSRSAQLDFGTRLGEPVEGLDGSAKHSTPRRRRARRPSAGARSTTASSPNVMPGESVESRTSAPFGELVTTLTSPLDQEVEPSAGSPGARSARPRSKRIGSSSFSSASTCSAVEPRQIGARPAASARGRSRGRACARSRSSAPLEGGIEVGEGRASLQCSSSAEPLLEQAQDARVLRALRRARGACRGARGSRSSSASSAAAPVVDRASRATDRRLRPSIAARVVEHLRGSPPRPPRTPRRPGARRRARGRRAPSSSARLRGAALALRADPARS